MLLGDSYVAKLTKSIQEANKTVRQNLGSSLCQMKHNYDIRNMERTYKRLEVVYNLDTAVVRGRCRKLCSMERPGVDRVVASLYKTEQCLLQTTIT